jgi:UDP-galactose transporter B1
MYSSNLALSYMSYPAQSLAKSCKLIPVMLMRIVVLGQRYRWREYMQVMMITAGICVFMLYEDGSKKGGGKETSTSVIGLLLCIVSLALDGFTGPTQEKINHQHKPSSHNTTTTTTTPAQRSTHLPVHQPTNQPIHHKSIQPLDLVC